jgi:small GTP-binding protein
METLKICIAGEGAVGKTSFLNKVINGIFDEKSKMTRGIDFFSATGKINVDGINYELILWDFGGQDHFREILQDFVDGASGALLLFDMTRFNTLDRLEEWIDMLTKFAPIPILILGTKFDLVDDETNSYFDEMLSKIVDAYDVIFNFIKISSKTGHNVKKPFELLIRRLNELKSP